VSQGQAITPSRPTPATLPRPSRPVLAQPGSAPAAAPAEDQREPGTIGEPTPGSATGPGPADSSGRRGFPNPASLMATGRGARKVRPGGLRARRLPKVEETSAGGVVLDLAADPPAVALIARHDRRSRLLWSLPKGHVEEGETPEQAALREVFEETGLLGRIVAPLGIIDFWFVVEDKRIHKTVHHFVIEAIGGELSDADLEVEAVEWIPYDQVVRRLAYGDERRLVEKVAQIVPGVR
jgi:ADP-ribose pyrophosphatase YjhB (NUDIX family)